MYSAVLNQTASVGIALAYPIWEAEEDCFYAPRFIEPAIYSSMDDPMEGGMGNGYANEPSGLFQQEALHLQKKNQG